MNCRLPVLNRDHTGSGQGGRQLRRQDKSEPTGADRSGRSGFTLLEVMIALAIASMALVTLLSLANRSIAVHDRLQKMTQATLLAQQKMTEIEYTQGGVDATRSEGAFAEPFAAYRWRVEYLPTPLPSVRQVDLTVSWGNGRNNEAVVISSFVF